MKAAALPRDSLEPSTSGNVPCATWLAGEAGRQAGHGAVGQDGMIEFHMEVCLVILSNTFTNSLWHPSATSHNAKASLQQIHNPQSLSVPSLLTPQTHSNHPDILSHPPFEDNEPCRQDISSLAKSLQAKPDQAEQVLAGRI